jgi:hypothetical protein
VTAQSNSQAFYKVKKLSMHHEKEGLECLIINEVTTKELQTVVARDSQVISLQSVVNLVKDEIGERKAEQNELYQKGYALLASYDQGRDVMSEITKLNG